MQWLLVLRFCVGLGLGGAHVPVALYMEYLPTNLRGLMLVALQSFWTLGTMIEVSTLQNAFPMAIGVTFPAKNI